MWGSEPDEMEERKSSQIAEWVFEHAMQITKGNAYAIMSEAFGIMRKKGQKAATVTPANCNGVQRKRQQQQLQQRKLLQEQEREPEGEGQQKQGRDQSQEQEHEQEQHLQHAELENLSSVQQTAQLHTRPQNLARGKAMQLREKLDLVLTTSSVSRQPDVCDPTMQLSDFLPSNGVGIPQRQEVTVVNMRPAPANS